MGLFLEWPNQHKIMKKLEKSCRTYTAYWNIFPDLIFCMKIYKSKYVDV